MGMVEWIYSREDGYMPLVSGIILQRHEDEAQLLKKACAKLGVPESDVQSMRIRKKSLDARRKNNIHWLYSLGVTLKGEDTLEESYEIEKAAPRALRPVVVGFGPGGMFCALALARAGLRPLVIERGGDTESRKRAVERFRSEGVLDTESNVQFGAGGAGTFSDGKLNSGIKDKRIGFVLRTLVENGAPENIMYDAKPHVGTDLLCGIVQSIHEEIERLGGEVRYFTKLTDILHEGMEIKGIEYSSGGVIERMDCDTLVLATGHSARDTYEMLERCGVPLRAKPFSLGARIEHLQTDIDKAQYGAERNELPTADYALSVHLPNGRSVYTFCMCPGGEVIASSSEHGGVLTNGMSENARSGVNANSALLVGVAPEDFPYEGALGGMYWQRDIERKAFEYGGGNYHAPCQTVGDFLKGVGSKVAGRVKPSYRPEVLWGDIRAVLPQTVTDSMAEALPLLGRKLKGFDTPTAVLTAPETRSSSPVRIERDEHRRSAFVGLIPCGEGAGYAGGIMSAAVDGLKCAESVINA